MRPAGIGSDVGEVAIFGGVIGIYRKHNCHVKGCPRIGKHPVEGTPYVVAAGIYDEKLTIAHLSKLSAKR